jgi:serine O-acetyltransferase
VVGIPGRIVSGEHKPVSPLEHAKLPDPVAEAIRTVLKEQELLKERIKALEKTGGITAKKDDLEETMKKIETEFADEDVW